MSRHDQARPAADRSARCSGGRVVQSFHDHVREGDVLKVKAPAGHSFIDPDPNIPAVLIAGGVGITPMLSMLRWCLAEQPDRSVHLYYGVRNSSHHAFKDLLMQLAAQRHNFYLNVVYSRAGAGDDAGREFQHAGHVDVELLRRTPPHGRHQFYVCGPPALMANLVLACARPKGSRCRRAAQSPRSTRT